MTSLIGSMTGITIESGFFSTKTTFELYPAHKRVVLLYGKNGCGKSTIAQGFREYANHKTPVGVELSPTKNGKVIQESTGQQGKIFVFDEEYVATRVQIKEDGLNAIVLFGEQIELEAQIARVENDISGKQIEIKNQEAECAEFTTSSNVKAPEYWTNRISGELKKSAGWADNGAKIKGNKINLSVSSDTINRLGGLSPARPQAELQEEFDRRYAQFKVVDSTTKPLPLVPPISIVGDKGAQAQDLLAKAVARPQWTPREKEIFDILGGQGLDAAKTYLSNTKVTVCDKCLQPISEEYRAAALRELACLLNRDIEEFKNELKQLLIPETAAAVYQIYSVLPSYCAVRDRIDDYNKAVYAHNDAVNAKIDNPFDSFEYPDSSVLIAANEAMSQALAMLKDDCALYNCSIKERDKVAKELQTINDELAHYAIDSMYASLKTQRDAKDDADKLLNKRYEELQALRKAKEQLNAKRRNFKLAANEINRSLEYIFYCKGRLTLELGADERYYLQVNGRKVAPNKVSCGERNALALSYFFTEIASNANTSAPYADEMLLVIDDPVSSFDFENKIGIQSLLRWKLEQVLGGCATSKALIMSHDISVVFDMGKGLKEIEECFKGKANAASYLVMQLVDRKVIELKCTDYNEYSRSLERIFAYADKGSDDSLTIGNTMRRVLEAFAAFSYKKDIGHISTNDPILSIIPENLREYFKNLMYKLVLHGESHYFDRIKGMNDYGFSALLSDSEKKRTARDILCFIYLLNKQHVLAHLSPSAENGIKTWIDSISPSASAKEAPEAEEFAAVKSA